MIIRGPMMAKSHANLPKAILVGAEFDGLRIPSRILARQLQRCGVDVTCYAIKSDCAFIDKLDLFSRLKNLADVISDAIKNL